MDRVDSPAAAPDDDRQLLRELAADVANAHPRIMACFAVVHALIMTHEDPKRLADALEDLVGQMAEEAGEGSTAYQDQLAAFRRTLKAAIERGPVPARERLH